MAKSAAQDLNGLRMTPTISDSCGVVSAETVLVFEQCGEVVSARYRGGDIVDGYLIGQLANDTFQFRYVQADGNGNLDAGVSEGKFEQLADGRVRLVERFQWITRPGGGTNIFDEIPST